MNTLKPLLTVAVLAGIGYGVYIRLNAGANAPPPPVDAGWNTTPDIQLPGQPGSAPWSPPGVPAAGNGAPPTASAPPTGPAPSFQPPAGAGPAPPFGQPPAAASAPPFGSSAPGPSAPPFGATDPTAPPTENVVSSAAPEPPAPTPGANPYEAAPPPGPVMESAPGGPPSGDPYGAPHAEPYGAPAGEHAPTDPSVPAGGAAPVDASLAPSGDFAATLAAAQRELENGQLASALRQLTPWYGKSQLTPDQQLQLCALLDQIAGTVVYSTQNLLENPYEVQPGERLEAIGEKYQVPWQLLAKINGIEDPGSLQPGERLKVIRGPFKAEISLDRREMVLFTADGLYAGRFKVGVGGEHPPQEGDFAVSDKSENPVYYGRDRAIGAEDPNNPLGERWIGLGKQMAIHGTNNPESIGRTDLPGWISLGQRDVEDVYDILSLGSRVTIRR